MGSYLFRKLINKTVILDKNEGAHLIVVWITAQKLFTTYYVQGNMRASGIRHIASDVSCQSRAAFVEGEGLVIAKNKENTGDFKKLVLCFQRRLLIVQYFYSTKSH